MDITERSIVWTGIDAKMKKTMIAIAAIIVPPAVLRQRHPQIVQLVRRRPQEALAY